MAVRRIGRPEVMSLILRQLGDRRDVSHQLVRRARTFRLSLNSPRRIRKIPPEARALFPRIVFRVDRWPLLRVPPLGSLRALIAKNVIESYRKVVESAVALSWTFGEAPFTELSVALRFELFED